MKSFLLVLAVPLGLSISQQALSDDIKAVASPITEAGELSWQRTISWANFIEKDPANSPATEIDGFEVSVVENMEPGNRKVTKYLTSWRFHNFTEDNRHASPLQLTITFYDKNGRLIDSYEEQSPRGFCTYSPAYQELIPEPIVSKGNRIEDISSAVLRVTYSATYEGSC
jgi:hypothetical protein